MLACEIQPTSAIISHHNYYTPLHAMLKTNTTRDCYSIDNPRAAMEELMMRILTE